MDEFFLFFLLSIAFVLAITSCALRCHFQRRRAMRATMAQQHLTTEEAYSHPANHGNAATTAVFVQTIPGAGHDDIYYNSYSTTIQQQQQQQSILTGTVVYSTPQGAAAPNLNYAEYFPEAIVNPAGGNFSTPGAVVNQPNQNSNANNNATLRSTIGGGYGAASATLPGGGGSPSSPPALYNTNTASAEEPYGHASYLPLPEEKKAVAPTVLAVAEEARQDHQKPESEGKGPDRGSNTSLAPPDKSPAKK